MAEEIWVLSLLLGGPLLVAFENAVMALLEILLDLLRGLLVEFLGRHDSAGVMPPCLRLGRCKHP